MLFSRLAVLTVICGLWFTFTARCDTAAPLTFSGKTRACAGGVADETHELRLTVSLRGGGGEVTFSLENGEGSFIQSDGTETPTLTVTMQQNYMLRIRSGKKACTPFLVAKSGGKELGRVPLDFALPIGYRRFPNPYDASDTSDHGYLFAPDNTCKFFLKFRKTMDIGNINGNWAPVAGHRLRVFFSYVDTKGDGSQIVKTPEEIAKYARLINPEDPAATDCVLTTREDGSVAFRATVAAGVRRSQIGIGYEDLTVDGTGYQTPGVPPEQELTNYSGRIAEIKWLQIPADLQARVLWDRARSASTQIFGWADINGKAPPRSNELRITSRLRHDSPVFSSDGRAVMFHCETNRFNVYDLALGDLTDGTNKTLLKNLWGNTEKWSPDGTHIAYLRGGKEVNEPLRVAVLDVGSGKEMVLYRDEYLQDVAWLPGGDLLASSSVTSKSGGARAPVIYGWKNARGEKRLWQQYANAPTVSPDGKWVAFTGWEKDEKGGWGDRSNAIVVTTASGSERQTLSRQGNGVTRIFPAPGEHVLVWTELHESVTNTPENGQLIPIRKTTLSLYEYTLEGKRRQIAQLTAKYQPVSAVVLADEFKPEAVSPNGKYFFFSRRESDLDAKKAGSMRITTCWYAVRLKDGKLFPLAATAGSDLAIYCF